MSTLLVLFPVSQIEKLVELARVPFTAAGMLRFQVLNALAATRRPGPRD